MADVTLNTPEARMSFMNLFVPSEDLNGNDKYSVTLLIPKSSNVEGLQAAIQQIIKNEAAKKFRGISPGNIAIPLKDGDAYAAQKPDKRQAYVGHWYINASKRPDHGKPAVLNEQGVPAEGPAEFDSGDYGIARVGFWGYNNKGNQGVSCNILGVKKTREGERFGGGESSNDTIAALGGLASATPEEENVVGSIL